MTEPTETPPAATHPTGEIIAKGDTWYRVKMVMMSLVIIGYGGGFFLYDGFVGWPGRNERIAVLRQKIDATKDEAEQLKLKKQMDDEGHEKSQADILLQKVIGFAALPLGFYMLVNTLRKSRGQIRLSDQTLHAPGHPPVPFEAITSLDNRLWEKKGIAYVNYSLSEGRNGKITLDDFIYERKAVDEIYDQVVKYIAPEESHDIATPASKEPASNEPASNE